MVGDDGFHRGVDQDVDDAGQRLKQFSYGVDLGGAADLRAEEGRLDGVRVCPGHQ